MIAAVQEELSDPRAPTVLVVEDVHWADDATLDVLRYPGRRIADLPAVLVITYRDDEIGRGSPAAAGARRVGRGHRCTGCRCGGCPGRRSPCWPAATDATAAALYRLTGGNPFFVSEVLAARDADRCRRTVSGRGARAGAPAGAGHPAGAGAARRGAVAGRAAAGPGPAAAT